MNPLIRKLALAIVFSVAYNSCGAEILRETLGWWIANNEVFELRVSKRTAEIRSAKLIGSDVELKAELSAHSLFYPEFEYQYHPDSWGGGFSPYYNGIVRISVPYNSDECAIMKVSYFTGFIDIFWDYKFLKGKPYFVVTTERVVKQSLLYNNAQQCAMFTTEMDDSYIVTYENNFVQTMDNGCPTSIYDRAPSTSQHSMFTAIDSGLGKRFPGIAWYDRDHDITVGVIVTDVSPNQRKTISYHGGARNVGEGYCEAQWNLFGKADDESIYLKKGTRYGMEMYYYLNYGDAETFDQFNRYLFNERHYDVPRIEHYYAVNWGGRASASPLYVWSFPQASNDWICTTELFRHRAIAIPSSQNGMRNCHVIDLYVKAKNNEGTIELTSTDPSHQIGATTEDHGNYMIGNMSWSSENLVHTLSYKMFEDSDRLIVSGSVQLDSEVNLSGIFVELAYSPRVTEAKCIDDYTWDIRCDDSVYGTIGITIYDPEGVERIEDTGKSLKLHVMENQNDQIHTPKESWRYSFHLFPHTGHKIEEKGSIPLLHSMPTEHYRMYHKTLVGHETSDRFGIEPNRNVFVFDTILEPDTGTIVGVKMYAEEGVYPIRFFIGEGDVGSIRQNGFMLPERNWRYDEASKVLTIDSDWRGPTFLEMFSPESAILDSVCSKSSKLCLGYSFPNPFRTTIIIPLLAPKQSSVRICVYDVMGRLVKEFLNSEVEAGTNVIPWDGRGDNGEKVGSGVYFYNISSQWGSITGKMVRLQ